MSCDTTLAVGLQTIPDIDWMKETDLFRGDPVDYRMMLVDLSPEELQARMTIVDDARVLAQQTSNTHALGGVYVIAVCLVNEIVLRNQVKDVCERLLPKFLEMPTGELIRLMETAREDANQRRESNPVHDAFYSTARQSEAAAALIEKVLACRGVSVAQGNTAGMPS